MKQYIGVRDVPLPDYGPAEKTSIVLVFDGRQAAPLKHHVKHSTTGFEWGYAGSAPADLARSMLADVLGDLATCQAARCVGGQVTLPRGLTKRCDLCWGTGLSDLVESYYQQLMREIVASMGARWVLSEEQVRTWLEGRITTEELPARDVTRAVTR